MMKMSLITIYVNTEFWQLVSGETGGCDDPLLSNSPLLLLVSGWRKVPMNYLLKTSNKYYTKAAFNLNPSSAPAWNRRGERKGCRAGGGGGVQWRRWWWWSTRGVEWGRRDKWGKGGGFWPIRGGGYPRGSLTRGVKTRGKESILVAKRNIVYFYFVW